MKMSQSQTKDELINLLKKNYDQMKQENTVLKKQNEEFKKGNAGSEEQTKALTEMHSQKVKTLLKSINNLKKEVQKEKFEKKDNVRIQKIQRLEKDIELQEVAMNALRKLINSEDKCEAAIAQAFASGPKRVRIASREELKIEINKYKNISLRLMEEIKRNGLKAPGYAAKANLSEPETGLREEKEKGATLATGGALDHLEVESAGASHMDVGGEGMSVASGEASAEQLIAEKHRLEEVIVKLNIEAKDKNEKLLELLENIEDLKIQVYSRDKSVELQQQQIEQLIEDLREAKQFEHQCKTLQIANTSLEQENARLQEEVNAQIEREVQGEVAGTEVEQTQAALSAAVADLTAENKALT